ncbi:MAG: PadR family transcriptional regulator [Propionibacteriaceae bacterium]|jgi:PadR family transcriptional regulator PadR|nr:PadR family transcriptional regulator [Propionibacteriaceae bacterium]
MKAMDWPGEWLRGTLELAVLGVIARQTTYGYQIAARLAEAGLGEVKGGTLYPLLSRLERDQLVTSRWGAGDGGPGRKYYQLTAAGSRRLAELVPAWHDFAARVAAAADPPAAVQPPHDSPTAQPPHESTTPVQSIHDYPTALPSPHSPTTPTPTPHTPTTQEATS